MISRAAIALLLLVGLATTARAQSDEALSKAKLYFETGRLLFEQGDYEQAARKFQAGYDLVPKPQFLLNSGLCYQKLGQLDKAKAMYERFLREAPADEPDRDKAQKLLGEVDQKLAERNPAPPPPLPPPPATTPVHEEAPPSSSSVTLATTAPPPRKSFVRRNWWIFPVAGVVIAGVAVGIYFGVRPSPNACAGSPNCLDLR